MFRFYNVRYYSTQKRPCQHIFEKKFGNFDLVFTISFFLRFSRFCSLFLDRHIKIIFCVSALLKFSIANYGEIVYNYCCFKALSVCQE